MPHVILGDLSTSSVNMALLIARVAVGAVFLAHGINHIYGGGKIEGTAPLVRVARHAARGSCTPGWPAWSRSRPARPSCSAC